MSIGQLQSQLVRTLNKWKNVFEIFKQNKFKQCLLDCIAYTERLVVQNANSF